MVALPPRSRLPVAALVALVLTGLGWLMFGLAGDRTGMRALPDSATGSTVETLKEHGRRLAMSDVEAMPTAAWTTWTGRNYINAEPGGAVWIRVTLHNPTNEPSRGVLADSEYFSDRVELWERTAPAANEPLRQGVATQGWRHDVSGEGVRTAVKPLWARMAPFPVDVPARGERTFFLRIEDRFAVWSRVVWWPRAGDFFAAQMRDLIAEAVCYGALLGLTLYNAMLWVRLRHADTGYYVLYASSMAAANFLANGGPALLGLGMGSPWKEVLATAALTGSGVFLVQFARVFLESKTRMPRADRWARGLRALLIGLGAGAVLIPWMDSVEWLYFVVPAMALTHGLLLSMAVIAWREGARHARFFVAAFGAVFVGALPAVVMWLERDVQKIAAMGILGGSTLEILLLAFAVADRFARLQRERAEAQQRLVEETEQRRVMQEAYADELEVEVRERTHELEAANADKDRMLTLLGHDLRSPLTAMTQTAEQIRGGSRSPFASTLSSQANPPPAGAEGLEPLRGFAGNVADAGRQMLLLIEDIVLWSRLRVGAAPARSTPEVRLIVNAAVLLHRALAERRKVDLIVDVPAGLTVQTDLVLAQALARNLVGNAVKFAHRQVEVTASVMADGVRLTVRDDGPGLPAAVVAWLHGGPAGDERGFGLRLCREIAAALGLRIEASAPPGGGTEMSVTLPIMADASASLAPTTGVSG